MTAASAVAAPGSNLADMPATSAAANTVSAAAQATPVEGEPSAPPALMRKAGRNRGNIRKRPAPDDATDSAAGDTERKDTSMMRPSKAQKAGAMAFTTRQTGNEALRPFNFASSRTLQQTTDQGATATLETETEFDRDARALREKVLAQANPEAAEAQPSDGTYKGINNYTDYTKGFRREHTIGAEKGTGIHGPLRANVHARMSVRFDYQPDICKDYKETGFCGYGDACKFVHDRSDYKSGWEMERDWAQQEKAKQQKILEGWNPDAEGTDGGTAADEEVEADDDELPFACFICRRRWEDCQDPVVTRCKHYFCEQCALKRNAKKGNGGRCAVCEAPTGGIFNVAHNIVKRVEDQRRSDAAAGSAE